MPTYHRHDCDKCQHIVSRPVMGQLIDLYRSCAGNCEYIIRYGEDGDYQTVWGDSRDLSICQLLEKEAELSGVRYVPIQGRQPCE